jgi:type II secretory pathway component HofQ
MCSETMSRRFQALVFGVSRLMFISAPLRAQEAARTPPVTLNLTEVDIHDFLRFAHEVGGMNIVVAPDVRGRVTALLDDVPWEQAFDAVLKTNGLIGLREGSVLRVVTVEGARREEQQRRELEHAKQTAAPLEVCTYRLENADARDTAGILGAFLSPRGRIAADTRTNSLIIADVPQVLEGLGITPVPPSRGRCIAGARIADD